MIKTLISSIALIAVIPGLATAAQDSPLTVCNKEAPPFAYKTPSGEWEGISTELWEQIALEEQLTFAFKEATLPEMIDGLQNGDCDVSLGALTMTAERERSIDFSHPYLNSGLGVIAQSEQHNTLLFLARKLFTWQFIAAVMSLALVLFLVGLVLWFVERKKNQAQFGGSNLEGVGSGFWWSAVTMTTVGYGDKAPLTLPGRIIGLIWMFASIIVISTFTATIASSLTVENLSTSIKSPADLYKVNVGTVAKSASAQFLDDRSIDHSDFAALDDALASLGAGEVQAVVYDKPLLQWLKTSESKYNDLQLLPFEVSSLNYAIALPEKSPLRNALNIRILEIVESKQWRQRTQASLGE